MSSPAVIPRIYSCPLCHARGSTDFFSIRDVPITCASIFTSRDQALAVPTGDVELSACDTCGLVYNRSFEPRLGVIGAKYESSQAASAHFSAFAQSLARDWSERYSLRGRTVLEVGCGNGDFLRRLMSEGAGRAIGVDPCCEPTKGDDPARDGIQLFAAAFDERYVDLQADALVCRHTIEHIQDVSGFMRIVDAWARRDARRVVLFELPASERIFSERAFWDVYYEHCNYFTRQSIRRAFEAAGLEVLRADCAYDDQYLIVEARAHSGNRPAPSPVASSSAFAECERFGREVSESIQRCRERLTQLASGGKPVVLWQGASKTVGFLSALGGCRMIEGAIDLSSERHGKFLPGSGLPVYPPEELLRLRAEHIVLMNPVYLQEVRAQVRQMGLDCIVHTVNELLERT